MTIYPPIREFPTRPRAEEYFNSLTSNAILRYYQNIWIVFPEVWMAKGHPSRERTVHRETTKTLRPRG